MGLWEGREREVKDLIKENNIRLLIAQGKGKKRGKKRKRNCKIH